MTSQFQDYEYKGLIVEAWDVLRGDTSNWADRAFYLDQIHTFGQPVLDIGCSTGRLTLDYLAHGIDIDGVDVSQEMLAECRRRASLRDLSPQLYQQLIEALDLPRRYRTILIPSSTTQLVTEPAQALEALRRVRSHLLPGGAVVASVMTLWQPGDPLETEWEKRVQRDDGVVFERTSRSHYDPTRECEDTEDVYRKLINGQVVAEEIHRRQNATRSYTQAQARDLFQRAGFVNVKLTSEFTHDPVKPTDTLFCVTARAW